MRVGSTDLDLIDLRRSAGVMLGVAIVLPLTPIDGIPCPLRSLTGIPCPLCGMTTSVAAAVHGDIAASVAANPAGLLAIAFALWLLVARRPTMRVPVIVPVVLLTVMWFYELSRFSVLSV